MRKASLRSYADEEAIATNVVTFAGGLTREKKMDLYHRIKTGCDCPSFGVVAFYHDERGEKVLIRAYGGDIPSETIEELLDHEARTGYVLTTRLEKFEGPQPSDRPIGTLLGCALFEATKETNTQDGAGRTVYPTLYDALLAGVEFATQRGGEAVPLVGDYAGRFAAGPLTAAEYYGRIAAGTLDWHR